MFDVALKATHERLQACVLRKGGPSALIRPLLQMGAHHVDPRARASSVSRYASALPLTSSLWRRIVTLPRLSCRCNPGVLLDEQRIRLNHQPSSAIWGRLLQCRQRSCTDRGSSLPASSSWPRSWDQRLLRISWLSPSLRGLAGCDM